MNPTGQQGGIILKQGFYSFEARKIAPGIGWIKKGQADKDSIQHSKTQGYGKGMDQYFKLLHDSHNLIQLDNPSSRSPPRDPARVKAKFCLFSLVS